MVRELYLYTEHPLDLSKLDVDEFQLEDVDDEDRKQQGNIAYIFSRALNYASSLIRYSRLFGCI